MCEKILLKFKPRLGDNEFVIWPKDLSDEERQNYYIVLDVLLTVATNLMRKDIHIISLLAPLNIVFSHLENGNILLGFSNDKSIKSNSLFIRWHPYSLMDLEETKKNIQEQIWQEFGVKIKYFTELNEAVLKNNEDILKELRMIASPLERAKKIDRFLFGLPYIQEAAEKLVENILEEEKRSMKFDPIFKARGLTIDDNMIFCALPFTDDRLEIFDSVLKPEIEKEFGMQVIRSGNVFQPNQNIMESVWTYINQARIVIVDVSDKNPNVFYELGICHTLGKQVILICDEDSLKNDYEARLPFDIGGIHAIFYKNRGNGMNELVDKLKYNIRASIDGKPYIAD